MVQTLRNTNLVASRCFKMKKTSLPVDVRRSKTPFLKLPSPIHDYVHPCDQPTLKLWLAIRFKIMTSCTWAFLPRIIVYNRYVWAFIPYTTIYIAYIRVFNMRICAKSNARLYALLKTRIYAYLSKPTYTRAKMCIYAGFRNQTWYKMARKVPLTE